MENTIQVGNYKLKYNFESNSQQTGDTSSIFPSISGPDFNIALKVMARDAKIQKSLSTHCGRHTFGTQMAILTNGNQYLIMDLMGHSDPTTTMIYVKLGERMVNMQLRNVNWAAYNPTPIKKELKARKKVPIKEPVNEQTKISDEKDDTVNEILEYIYQEIIPKVDFNANEKIPFAIDIKTLNEYVGLLPFSSEDINKYQNQPFILSAYLIGMKYSKYVKELERAINSDTWLKESCLKVQLKFLPVPLKGLKIIEIG